MLSDNFRKSKLSSVPVDMFIIPRPYRSAIEAKPGVNYNSFGLSDECQTLLGSFLP